MIDDVCLRTDLRKLKADLRNECFRPVFDEIESTFGILTMSVHLFQLQSIMRQQFKHLKEGSSKSVPS